MASLAIGPHANPPSTIGPPPKPPSSIVLPSKGPSFIEQLSKSSFIRDFRKKSSCDTYNFFTFLKKMTENNIKVVLYNLQETKDKIILSLQQKIAKSNKVFITFRGKNKMKKLGGVFW